MRILFCLAVLLTAGQLPSAAESQSISFENVATIDEASFSSVAAKPVIHSFDLSPDGKGLALLVVDGSEVNAPLWLATWEISSKRLTRTAKLGPSVFPMSGFAPQVLYVNNGRFIVVQDLQTVRLFNADTLDLIRVISPPSQEFPLPRFVARSANSPVVVCAFTREQKFIPRFHTTRVKALVVNTESGAVLGKWDSDDVPQAVSPNGALIAVSSTQSHGRVLPLAVVDVSGKKVAELNGGFSFHGDPNSRPLGRVIGSFVSDQQLILTADENIDESGRHAGDRLVLGSLGEKRAANQNINIERYAPAGELASSADTVLATSWYVPARLLVREGRLPESFPELLVLKRNSTFSLRSRIQLEKTGLKVSGWLENHRPRLSADASVIAIAQGDGVGIFRASMNRTH